VFVYVHPCMHIESSSFYSLSLKYLHSNSSGAHLGYVQRYDNHFRQALVRLHGAATWCGYTLGLDTMAASHIGPVYLVLHRMFMTHGAFIFGLSLHVWCCIASNVLHRMQCAARIFALASPSHSHEHSTPET